MTCEGHRFALPQKPCVPDGTPYYVAPHGATIVRSLGVSCRAKRPSGRVVETSRRNSGRYAGTRCFETYCSPRNLAVAGAAASSRWCRRPDSNWQPSHYECAALPLELRRREEVVYPIYLSLATKSRKAFPRWLILSLSAALTCANVWPG